VADSKQYKILVIDDEAATLTMFRLFLSAYGYRVWVSEDGEAGLALARRHRPDIVFTDLKMPNMDGFEVLKEIKRMAPDTEVIVITGHGDMDLIVQALNLNATDFINKPISRRALDAALRRATERLRQPVPENGRVEFMVDRHGVGRLQIYGTLRRDNRDQLLQCCRQVRERKSVPVLFQFMDNAAVDGPGITELINCLAAIRKNNQCIALMGLSENFKVIFETVGVARFASLCDTEDEALAALGASNNDLTS
jgi:CheY-like chemotaxis protein/anti-anti-sigma regulatory factor